ncbi:hypothetical protein RB195_024642 [Necator americanus]|uniref:Uncharacterized protein n=1 Tax=Necator americanus TaxID=51031 RepID=A0ABR1EP33_NECAM
MQLWTRDREEYAVSYVSTAVMTQTIAGARARHACIAAVNLYGTRQAPDLVPAGETLTEHSLFLRRWKESSINVQQRKTVPTLSMEAFRTENLFAFMVKKNMVSLLHLIR